MKSANLTGSVSPGQVHRLVRCRRSTTATTKFSSLLFSGSLALPGPSSEAEQNLPHSHCNFLFATITTSDDENHSLYLFQSLLRRLIFICTTKNPGRLFTLINSRWSCLLHHIFLPASPFCFSFIANEKNILLAFISLSSSSSFLFMELKVGSLSDLIFFSLRTSFSNQHFSILFFCNVRK